MNFLPAPDHIVASASIVQGLFGSLDRAWLHRPAGSEQRPNGHRPSTPIRSHSPLRPLSHVGIAVGILAFWHYTHRPFAGIGVLPPDGVVWVWMGAAVLGGTMGASFVDAIGKRMIAARNVPVPAMERIDMWEVIRAPIIGISEEINFRGFLLWYTGFYWVPQPLAMVLVALVFAWVHQAGHWARFVVVLALGLVTGSLVLLPHSLWPACLAHIAYNLAILFHRSRLFASVPSPESSVAIGDG